MCCQTNNFWAIFCYSHSRSGGQSLTQPFVWIKIAMFCSFFHWVFFFQKSFIIHNCFFFCVCPCPSQCVPDNTLPPLSSPVVYGIHFVSGYGYWSQKRGGFQVYLHVIGYIHIYMVKHLAVFMYGYSTHTLENQEGDPRCLEPRSVLQLEVFYLVLLVTMCCLQGMFLHCTVGNQLIVDEASPPAQWEEFGMLGHIKRLQLHAGHQ